MARMAGARAPADRCVTLVSASSKPSARSLPKVAKIIGSDNTTAASQYAERIHGSGTPGSGPAGQRAATNDTTTNTTAMRAAFRSICSDHFRTKRLTRSGLRRPSRPTQSV